MSFTVAGARPPTLFFCQRLFTLLRPLAVAAHRPDDAPRLLLPDDRGEADEEPDVWLHHALDGRERYESGELKLQ